LSCSYSVLTFGSFSFLVVPLSEEFGWGRGDISLALAILNYTVAGFSFASGAAVDRWGSRAVIIPAQIAFAATLIGMAFFNGPLTLFFLLYFVMGLAGTANSPPAYSKIVVELFDRGRGLALALSLAGVGVGYTLVPLASQWVVSEHGWRYLYAFLATLLLVVAIPTCWIWLHLPATSRSQKQAVPAFGFEFASAVRKPTFALLVTGFGIAGLFSGGYYAHIGPLLTDSGMSGRSAAGAVALSGIALIVGRLVAGWLLDRLHAPVVVTAFMCLAIIGFALLWSGAGGTAVIVAVLLIGLSLGAEMDFMSFLVSRYFGIRSYGKLSGIVYGVFVLGTAVGPLIMGYSQQITGGYQGGLVIIMALSTLSLPTFALLGRYPDFKAEADGQAAMKTARAVPSHVGGSAAARRS
jgi:MFS family permease